MPAIDSRARRRYRRGIGSAQRRGFLDREADRDIAGERIVRRRLVGDEVEGFTPPCSSGTISAALPSSPTESGRRVGGCGADPSDRVVDGVRDLVEVARLEPPLDAGRVDLDAEDRRAGHRRRQRLRAAHAAETGGQDRAAAAGRRCRSASRPPPRTSGRCPGGCPACRCRSSSRPSSGRTSSAPPPPAGGTRPTSPSAARAASSRSGRAARPRACGRRRPACRSARAASRRRPGAAAFARSPAAPRANARRGPSLRTRRGPPDARRPPGRGC